MKRSLIVILVAALVLAGCARSKVICGVEYQPYGLLTEDEKKNPDIQYEPVWGNIIWGMVLLETVVFPIYFGGFALFQPVGPKPKIKGAVVAPTSCPLEYRQ